jgi:hypothetical protein
MPLPPGISVHRDIYARDEWDEPCIEVRVMHQEGATRRLVMFRVPYYKTVGWVRTGLFRHKEIEITDRPRIDAELNEKGWASVRELLDASAGGRA